MKKNLKLSKVLTDLEKYLDRTEVVFLERGFSSNLWLVYDRLMGDLDKSVVDITTSDNKSIWKHEKKLNLIIKNTISNRFLFG
jgi:hypothetical protein